MILAGSVTVNADGTHSGEGLALELYEAEVAARAAILPIAAGIVGLPEFTPPDNDRLYRSILALRAQQLAAVLARRSGFELGPDAAYAVTGFVDIVRVPSISNNRVWTMPDEAEAGTLVTVSRPRATDNFSLTLQREDATPLAIVPALVASWVELLFTTRWVANRWGPGVTSINTDAL